MARFVPLLPLLAWAVLVAAESWLALRAPSDAQPAAWLAIAPQPLVAALYLRWGRRERASR